jgi:hypothetical protein
VAFATAKPRLYLPSPPSSHSSLPNFSTTTLLLDASDETAVFIVEAPKSGNIRKVLWGTRTVTTGATIDVRIETLNRTGTPAINSGTLWGTTTNGSQVVADGDDNTTFVTQLTADAAVTQGDPIAVVIKNPTASPGTMQIAGLADDADLAYPYCLLNGAAAAAAPVVALEYSDGSYEPIEGAWPIASTITATVFSSASTPDTIGFRYQLPYPHRLRGFWLWADLDGDATARVVTSAYHQANATGILVSKTLNNEDRETASPGVQKFIFPSSIEQSASTNYRCIIEPGGTNLTLYDMSLHSLAAMDAWLGDEFHLTTAKDPTGDGDWTNYNSGTFRMLFGGLILDGFSDGAGGSGGVIGGPNMRAGMMA